MGLYQLALCFIPYISSFIVICSISLLFPTLTTHIFLHALSSSIIPLTCSITPSPFLKGTKKPYMSCLYNTTKKLKRDSDTAGSKACVRKHMVLIHVWSNIPSVLFYILQFAKFSILVQVELNFLSIDDKVI